MGFYADIFDEQFPNFFSVFIFYRDSKTSSLGIARARNAQGHVINVTSIVCMNLRVRKGGIFSANTPPILGLAARARLNHRGGVHLM